jgi:hypothetical protein
MEFVVALSTRHNSSFIGLSPRRANYPSSLNWSCQIAVLITCNEWNCKEQETMIQSVVFIDWERNLIYNINIHLEQILHLQRRFTEGDTPRLTATTVLTNVGLQVWGHAGEITNVGHAGIIS